MAATVVVAERNGPLASSTETIDVTNVNFGSADQAALNPTSAPITAQANGHSYEKWLRLYVNALGGSTLIDNVKIWLSNLGGGWKTGEGMSCNMRTSGYSSTAYQTGGPVQTDSSFATQVMPTSEPGGANLGIAGSLSGSISAVPAYTDYAVIQLDVSAATPAGAVNTKTITFQWDEQ
jgi:hypothetical protein